MHENVLSFRSIHSEKKRDEHESGIRKGITNSQASLASSKQQQQPQLFLPPH
jgi:hypothetical protein